MFESAIWMYLGFIFMLMLMSLLVYLNVIFENDSKCYICITVLEVFIYLFICYIKLLYNK